MGYACTCVYTCLCAYACVHTEASCLPQLPWALCFETESHLWSCGMWLTKQARDPRVSRCALLCLPFHLGSGGGNSDPRYFHGKPVTDWAISPGQFPYFYPLSLLITRLQGHFSEQCISVIGDFTTINYISSWNVSSRDVLSLLSILVNWEVIETVLNIMRQKVILQLCNQEQKTDNFVGLCSLFLEQKKKSTGFLVTVFGVKYNLTVSLAFLRNFVKMANIFIWCNVRTSGFKRSLWITTFYKH